MGTTYTGTDQAETFTLEDNDIAFGNGGNDRFRAFRSYIGNVTIHGGDGNDTVDPANWSSVVVFGDAGNDVLAGGYFSSYLDGGDGDDTFLMTKGLYTILGGNGNDLITINLPTIPPEIRIPEWDPQNLATLENSSIYGDAGIDSVNITADVNAKAVIVQGINFFDLTITYLTNKLVTLRLFDIESVKLNSVSVWPVAAAVDHTFTGTTGNDSFTSGTGNDSIDGGAGLDTAVFTGTRSSHTVTQTSSGWTVSSTADGTDTIQNIERLQFSDETLALDINGVAGQAYRVYQAAFNRTPDNAGLKFWIDGMDHGTSLHDVAAGFINSAEFQSIYGSNPTNEQFVTNLYAYVMHRQLDQAGYDFWVGDLNANRISRIDTLVQFSEAAENQANVIGVIQHGIDLLN